MFVYGFLTALVVVFIVLTILGNLIRKKRVKEFNKKTMDAYNKKKGAYVKKNKVLRKTKKKVSENS